MTDDNSPAHPGRSGTYYLSSAHGPFSFTTGNRLMQTLTEFIPRFRTLGAREAIRHATVHSCRVVTWIALYEMIGDCISYLEERGVRQGDRVMIQAENSPEWVALFWACVARGIH